MKRFGISLVISSISLVAPSVLVAQGTEMPATTMIPAGVDSLPHNPQPGKCYARVWEGPTYRTVTEKVLRREAGERVELIPAKYEMVEEQVLVREAYTRAEVVAPQYETVTEKIMVKPAYTRWKKGQGLIENVDNFTGEIMCLEEVPAEYKTVMKQTLRAPGTTNMVDVPAEYKIVKVQKLMTPAQEKRIQIPEQYETIHKTVLVSKGHMAWQTVMCETNATSDRQVMINEVKPVQGQAKVVSSLSRNNSSVGTENPWIFWGFK